MRKPLSVRCADDGRFPCYEEGCEGAPLRLVVVGALVALAVFGAARALSGRQDDASEAIVRSITTPIERAARVEAEANVHSAMRAVQIYFADNGTYSGISLQALRAMDRGVSPTVQIFPAGAGYCLMATVRNVTVRNVGPSTDVTDGSCLGPG